MQKTIYFVRHGETLLNRMQVHQYPETPLTPRGRQQAAVAALTLADLRVEAIVSSDLVRAAETATIIARRLDVPLTYAEEFREIRRPTSLWGKHHAGLDSLLFFVRHALHNVFGLYPHDHAETLREFKDRIDRGLDLLLSVEAERVAVVTHRGAISLLRATMHTRGKANTLRLAFAFLRLFAIQNAQIVVAEHDGSRWRLAEPKSKK